MESSILSTISVRFILVRYPTTTHSYCLRVCNCCLANIISLIIYLCAYINAYCLSIYQMPYTITMKTDKFYTATISSPYFQKKKKKKNFNKSSIICQNTLPYIILGTHSKGHQCHFHLIRVSIRHIVITGNGKLRSLASM